MMRGENDLHSNYLDRLFEYRNKKYGAYTLRKAYKRQLMKASMGMGVVVLCICGYFFRGGHEKLSRTSVIDSAGIVLCSIGFDEPEIPNEGEITNKKRPVTNGGYMVSVIVPDTLIKKSPYLEDVPAVTTTRERIANSLILPDLSPPEEIGTDAASSADSVGLDLYLGSCNETMPEYPGGREAMFRFINSNLRLPDSLPGIKNLLGSTDTTTVPVCITIYVQFRIDADGQITDIQFPRTAFEPYQTEVRRVFEAMPKWIPGSRDKKTVPMYSSLPIKILLAEE